MIVDFLHILRRVTAPTDYTLSPRYQWRAGRQRYPAIQLRRAGRMITWTPLTRRQDEVRPAERKGGTLIIRMPWLDIPSDRRYVRVTLRNYPRGEGIQRRAPDLWEAAIDGVIERLQRYKPVRRVNVQVVNDRNQRPIRGARVELDPAESEVLLTPDYPRVAETNEEGIASFDYVNRGRARIRAEADYFHPREGDTQIRYDVQRVIIQLTPFEEFPTREWARYKAWAYWKHGPEYRWEREVDMFLWAPVEEAPTENELLDLLEVVFLEAMGWQHARARRQDVTYDEQGRSIAPYMDYTEHAGVEPESSVFWRGGGSGEHPVDATLLGFEEYTPVTGDSGVRIFEPVDPNDPDYDDFPHSDLAQLGQLLDWEHWERNPHHTRPHLRESGELWLTTAWRMHQRLISGGRIVPLSEFFGERREE